MRGALNDAGPRRPGPIGFFGRARRPSGEGLFMPSE